MAALRRRLSASGGFTLVEVMIAMAIVLGGAATTVQLFDASRKLAIKNERREIAVHRAEKVLADTANIEWTLLGHPTPPAADTTPNRPANAVTASGNFDFDLRSSANASEPFVFFGRAGVDLTGSAVASTPQTWSDGQARVSGRSQVFVTSPSTSPFERRVTVVVTVDSPSDRIKPIVMSTLATDPRGA